MYKKLIAKQLSQDFQSAVEIVEVGIPAPAPNQVVIRNQFAGINAGFDTLVCQGEVPYVDLKPPFDLGVEAVGEVIAVGHKVEAFNVGDAVATTNRGGGYREYQAVDAGVAVKVPEAIPEILTLMPTGISALVALEQVGQMRSQEVVLVTAAAGGTGHIAVQLAKLAGNHVIGTCGSEVKSQVLKQLGCDRVINYRVEDINQVLKQEYSNGVNLVFECVGKELFDICIDNLAVRGRLVVVGFIAEYANHLERVCQPRIYQKLFWKAASVRGFLMPHYAASMADARDRLLDLFSKDKIQVVIDPIEFKGVESIPAAVDYLLRGQNCGKVVVRF